jgi:lysozyme
MPGLFYVCEVYMSLNTTEQVKRHEGFRGQPYLCSAGATTIGYGRNLDANPLTEEEAAYLLANDLEKVRKELNGKVQLMGHCCARQGVIVNMAFNMGIPRLMKFKNMLAAFKVKDYETAAKEMLDSRWANQVKGRALALANQMLTGDWQ